MTCDRVQGPPRHRVPGRSVARVETRRGLLRPALRGELDGETLPISRCVRCGCTDHDACRHDDGDPCGWAILSTGVRRRGICTVCVEGRACA